MSATRREVLFLISGFVSSAVELEGLPNQDNSIPSTTYPFSELRIRIVNGAAIRLVLKGKLATAESLEVHETTLPPGGIPHAAHIYAGILDHPEGHDMLVQSVRIFALQK